MPSRNRLILKRADVKNQRVNIRLLHDFHAKRIILGKAARQVKLADRREAAREAAEGLAEYAVSGSFATVEDAWDWLVAEVDDPFRDNSRFAFLDDPAALAEYRAAQAAGCCGSFDAAIRVAGRRAMIGCNYGH